MKANTAWGKNGAFCKCEGMIPSSAVVRPERIKGRLLNCDA